MTVHNGIKEKVASGIRRRGGFSGDSCLGVRILDGAVGGEVRGGVFPNQPLERRLRSGHRVLVDSLINSELGEQREGALDHVGLAVRALFFHVESERGILGILHVEICRGSHDGCCAEDGFPSAPEHPGTLSCWRSEKWLSGDGGMINRESVTRELPFFANG